ncbi:MAG: hypothetical protein GC162_07525 [Planctomycetes bacterium]|nr:hypothetical protein [Planctomycetota bacterium]
MRTRRPLQRTRFAVAALFALGMSFSPVNAELLLYEPFNYTAGANLTGQGGTTEWGFDAGSTWTFGGSQTADLLADSIPFGTNLITEGNKLRYNSNANANLENAVASRPIDFTVSGGTLWMSYLTQNSVSDQTNTGKGVFIDESATSSGGGSRKFSALAKRNGVAAAAVEYNGVATNAGADYNATTQAYMVIAKFENVGSGGGTAKMWGLTSSEFDSIYGDYIITEAELNAVVPAARQVTTTVGTQTTVTTNDFLNLLFVDQTAGANAAFWTDEVRVGNSLNDMTAGRIAYYDFTGSDGNFNTTAFDSRDTQNNSAASRIANHGFALGGSGVYIITNTAFDTSESTSPGLNLGGGNQTSPTHYISFTVDPGDGIEMYYEALTLYGNTYYANDQFNLELRVVDGNGSEVSLGTYSYTPGNANNESVKFITFNFANFASYNTTEWRIYGWNTQSADAGIRLDDITLFGSVVAVPAPLALPAGLGLLGMALMRRRI